MTGPEFPLQLDTVFHHISVPQIVTRIHFSVLSSASGNRQIVSKYQTLIYLKFYGYVRLSDHSSP